MPPSGPSTACDPRAAPPRIRWRTRRPQRGPGFAAERSRRARGRLPSPSAPKCIPSPSPAFRWPSPAKPVPLRAEGVKRRRGPLGPHEVWRARQSELGEAPGLLLYLRGGERQRGTEKRARSASSFTPTALTPPAAPALPRPVFTPTFFGRFSPGDHSAELDKHFARREGR